MHENLRLVTYWNAPLSKLLLAKSNDYQGNESTYAHGLSSLTQNLCLKPLLHQAISLIKIPAARILTLSSTKNVSEQIKIPLNNRLFILQANHRICTGSPESIGTNRK